MNKANHHKNLIRRIIISVLAVIFALTGAGAANAANLLDVSSWQTGINVTTTGADIVVAKATEGTYYVNHDCDRVIQQALSSGKGAGVYHFANTADSPIAEADYFVSQTRGYVGKGIVPILDWEPRAPGNVQWAQTWLNRVESQWGTKPIIYMNQSTENSYNWAPVVQQNYGLWIAAYTLGYQPIYGFNPPAAQPRMYHWPFAVAWQYTSSGRVNGWNGNVDLSVVYGSLDTWRAYAGGGSTAAAPTTPQTPAAPSISGSDSELADRVIRGEFGTIPQRQAILGSRYAAVQAIVNQRLNGVANSGSNFIGACAIVARGDSLSGIASRLGTNWQNLTGYRSGNPNRIYPGERVCTKTGNAPVATGHRVRSGESLWAIYGTGWQAAAVRNGIQAPYTIYPGQTLR